MPTSTDAPLSPWPLSPEVHGWLSLDRRGIWRLKGEPVSHGGLNAFLNQHYRLDTDGRAWVANGPQRVYVALAYTPWVHRLDADGQLCPHTGGAPQPVRAAWLDDEGNALLLGGPGIGVLDDRDLAAFIDDCRLADGTPPTLEALLDPAVALQWRGLALGRIARADVARHFGFDPGT